MRLLIYLACLLGLTLGARVQAGSCFCLVDAEHRVYHDCQEGFKGAAHTRQVECKLGPGPLRTEVTVKPGTTEVPAGKDQCDPCEVMAPRAGRHALRTPDDGPAATKGTHHE